MADRPEESRSLDLSPFIGKSVVLSLKTAEVRDERTSRLRREEAEDAYKRRISLIVHLFVMAIVAVAFLTSAYIA